MPLVGYFCMLCAALTIQGSSINLFGHPVGTYVDDQVPHHCQVAQATVGFVVVGQAPSGLACPGVLNAHEWYPYDCHDRWGPLPAARAYILQDTFHWPGCPQPTARQRRILWRVALKHHPALILWN